MSLEGPLGAFTDAILGKLIELEECEAEYIRALGGSAERGIGATVLLHPGLPHPAFNTVVGLDAEGHDPSAFVRRIEGAFGAAGLPFQFTITPLSRPAEFVDWLLARGYMQASERLWMELMSAPPASSGDPRIQIGAPPNAALWAQTAAVGLGAFGAEPLLHELARRTEGLRGHTLLLATYGGAPAGACEVSVDSGIGTLRRVGVLPPFRNREVLRSLLHTACEAAYAFDAFRIVTRTFPASGSVPLFEALGFAGTHLGQDFVRAYPPFLLD